MATLPQAPSSLTPQELQHDAQERRRIVDKILADGPMRLATELDRLRGLGVIDADGNLIPKTIPADMMPGAERDFGG